MLTLFQVNIGKWVLRNLFIGFIREEQRTRRSRHHANMSHEAQNIQKVSAPSPSTPRSTSPTLHATHMETTDGGTLSRHRSSVDIAAGQVLPFGKTQGSSTVISSANMIPAIAPSPISSATPTTRSSPLLTPLIPLHPLSKDKAPKLVTPQLSLGGNDAPPMLKHTRSLTANDGTQSKPVFNTTGAGDYHTMRTRHSNASPVVVGPPDEPKHDGVAPQTPLTPGGGLMGRLKQFGKVSGRKGSSEVDSASKPTVVPELKSEVLIEIRHRHGPILIWCM